MRWSICFLIYDEMSWIATAMIAVHISTATSFESKSANQSSFSSDEVSEATLKLGLKVEAIRKYLYATWCHIFIEELLWSFGRLALCLNFIYLCCMSNLLNLKMASCQSGTSWLWKEIQFWSNQTLDDEMCFGAAFCFFTAKCVLDFYLNSEDSYPNPRISLCQQEKRFPISARYGWGSANSFVLLEWENFICRQWLVVLQSQTTNVYVAALLQFLLYICILLLKK